MYEIRFEKGAEKKFKSLDGSVRKRLAKYLDRIAQSNEPRASGHPLSNVMAGKWVYKPMPWRIVCKIDDDNQDIIVLDIDNRDSIYERKNTMIKVNEASYSRIYQHTQDDSTFAIIGSEDKDTHEDRSVELHNLVYKYSRKKHIGFNSVRGMYTYQQGNDRATAYEKSLILYDIDKKTALEIANAINQESIVWKDPTFFGIIYTDGSVMMEFNNEYGKNMSFSNAQKMGFGTKLPRDMNNEVGFTFEGFKGTILYPDIHEPIYEDFMFTRKK